MGMVMTHELILSGWVRSSSSSLVQSVDRLDMLSGGTEQEESKK